MFDLPTISFIGFAHFIFAFVACSHILLNKDKEGSALLWIGVVLLSPFIGSLVYVVFGINRINRLAWRRRKGSMSDMPIVPIRPKADELASHVNNLFMLKHKMNPQSFSSGNSVQPLLNGADAFKEMFKAIDQAQKVIALETYIFDRDRLGIKFAKKLIEAHKRGVEVYVIIDNVGMHYRLRSIFRELHRGGIKIQTFSPLYLPQGFNMRNHRKLLLIDGQTGFLGGMNIRQGNILWPNSKHAIQDIHFMVRGQVLDQLNETFEEDWLYSSKQNMQMPKWVKNTPLKNNSVIARAIPDGPDANIDRLQWTILGELNYARKHVRILTPYFLPNDLIINALIFTALRGVEVELIMPARSNIPLLDWAMQANFLRLIEQGIKLYQGAPPFDHSKLLLIDDHCSLIGSSNWDARSLRLNFEINLECFSPELNEQLTKVFELKKKKAKQLLLAEVQQWKMAANLRNNFFRLFAHFL